MFSLGQIAWLAGNLIRTEQLSRESLALRWSIREMRTLADSIGMMACVAATRGGALHAARLFGATAAVREITGAVAMPWLLVTLDQELERVRAVIGSAKFQEAFAEGQHLNLAEAVHYALTVDLSRSVLPEDGKLTRRERQVVALVGRALTNRGIAEILVISERTAEAHLSNVLHKLGLSSRAQLVAWAAHHTVVAEANSPTSGGNHPNWISGSE